MKLAIISLLLSQTYAVMQQGRCVFPGQPGAVSVSQNIDLDKLIGDWYPIYTDSQDLKGYQPLCIKVTQTLAPKSPTLMAQQQTLPKINALNSPKNGTLNLCDGFYSPLENRFCQLKQFQLLMDPQNTGTVYGHMTYLSKDNQLSGVEWTTKFNLNGNSVLYSSMFDYLISLGQIVDTDYKNFIIFYTCLDVPGIGMKNEKVFIHSRDPNITDDARNKLIQIANEKISKVQSQQNLTFYNTQQFLSRILQGKEGKCLYV